MRKYHRDAQGLIYIYINSNCQFVQSYGIEFAEFIQAIPAPIENMLLLKHKFAGGYINMHTLLDVVPSERMDKLKREPVDSYGDFCWVDFEVVDGVNELTQQEIAELLYLGHFKHHLRLPFYNQLGNRYVYLAHDDGWYNKTYYRNLDDFYVMLGEIITQKANNIKITRNLFGFNRRRVYPPMKRGALYSLSELMKEGIVISLEKAAQNRNLLEIPLWVVGDFINMDDMYEEYRDREKQAKWDAKIVFNRKSRDWHVYHQ